MYKELSDVMEAVGKTVESITHAGFGGQVIVAFEDETFILFGIERGYESCDDVIARLTLDPEDFGRDALIASGIISREDLFQRMEELAEARRLAREAAERRRYERLKARFEP